MALNASDHGETFISFGAAIFLTSFTSLQAIIGAAANLAVFITILCTRQLRQRSEDRLIANLAVADFLSLTTFVPWHAYALSQRRFLTKAELGYYIPLMTLVFNYGGIAIVAIAVDRYVAVVYPLRYCSIMTTKTTRCLIVFSFATALTFSLADRLMHAHRNIINAFFFAFDLSLLVVIAVIYAVILYWALKQRKAILERSRNFGMTHGHRNSWYRRIVRTTLTSLGFAVLYYATYLPLIVYIVRMFSGEFLSRKAKLDSLNWIYSFLFLNSCVNPFVYSLRTRRFKMAFCRMVRAKISHNPSISEARRQHTVH
jgi:galanin receptor 1/galanin receptor 2